MSPIRASGSDHPGRNASNEGHQSGKGTSEGSKKTIISAKDMPASKVKKDPIIKRETSPMALANKEAEEKQAQQALKLLEQKKLS